MTEEKRTTMRVILCRPNEMAEVIEMEDSLESMQKMVGGLIEEYMPWEDEVALICNEEGKLNGMEYNRAIRDENGEVREIIAGPFLIVGLDEDSFGSLSEDMLKKYQRLFAQPEVFLQTQSQLLILPYAMDEFCSRDSGDMER